MYEAYWGLSETPFAHRPSTRWFQESPVHEEALARMFYLVEHRRGFGVLCGEAGTGKSLTLRVLADQSLRSQRKVAMIDLLGLNEHEMLWQLAIAMRLSPAESDSRWRLWRRITDEFTSFELSRQQVVFVFDHLERADSGCHALLERIYSAATSRNGFGTFIVSVRNDGLERASRFLSESADLRVDLPRLELDETDAFIRGLVRQAGGEPGIFSGDAVLRIHQHSGGVPRSICRLCEMSLIAGMARHSETVDGDLIDSVAGTLVTVPADRTVETCEYV